MLHRLILALGLAAVCPAQPARIVSTSPSITETLFALDLGDRVVGVSTYCRYPPAVLSLPKVGTYMKPDPEKIALLRPDLVVVHEEAASLADRLTALRIRHARIKVGSLAQVYTMVHDIAAAAGVSPRAEPLNARIRSRLDALRKESEGKPKPSVVVLVGRNPGLLTNLVAAGPGTYLGELLEIAGGRNILSDVKIAYPHISLETVVSLNPDIILDATQMGESNEDNRAREQRLREPWLSHRELGAVRNGLVFGLTSETLVTPGPRVVDAVELMREKIRAKDRR
jgi:iron complex transport system substrate-binding protein